MKYERVTQNKGQFLRNFTLIADGNKTMTGEIGSLAGAVGEVVAGVLMGLTAVAFGMAMAFCVF